MVTERSRTDLLVSAHFGDIVQLEQDGLLKHYEDLHADEVPDRRFLLEAGAQLSDTSNLFLGYYRTAGCTCVGLSVRSVCQNYLDKYDD